MNEIRTDLSEQTSGGGTKGVYQTVVIDGQKIEGLRGSDERITLFDNVLGLDYFRGNNVIDIGCNLGVFCKYAIDRGAYFTTGIDINPKFIDWAKRVSPKTQFVCADLNKEKPDLTDNYDVVLLLAVWDYFDDKKAFVDYVKSLFFKKSQTSGLYRIIFEAHADGDHRIDNDVEYQGKTLKSWKHIIEKEIGAKSYRFLGTVDNGTRPIWELTL